MLCVVAILLLLQFPAANPACSDLSASCKFWAEDGECTKNLGWMVENCPVTCKSSCECPGQAYPGTNPDTRCACHFYAQDEYCEKEFPEWMDKNCQSVCAYRKNITCGDPPKIRYTVVNNVGNSRWLAKVTYACAPYASTDQDPDVATGMRLCSRVPKYATWIRDSDEDPICVLKNCTDSPTDEPHSTWTATPPRQADNTYMYDTVITYTCDTGYEVKSGDTSRKCFANTTFTGLTAWKRIVCGKISCGKPPELINGSVSYKSTSYDDKATYSCDFGYTLTGSGSAICQANRLWSNSNSTCERTECGILDVTNGNVTYLNDTYFGSFASVFCDLGHVISDDTEIQCLENGLWSAMPHCKRKNCSIPQTNSNGYFQYNNTLFGDSAELFCQAGFQTEQISPVKCLETGNWEEFSECTKVRCGALSVDGGLINDTATDVGVTVSIECRYGYNINGPNHITCLVSGQWSANSSCKRVQCGRPEDIKHGIVEYTGDHLDSIAQYACLPGYLMSGPSQSECTSDNRWTPRPSCHIKNCGSPPKVDFSTVKSTGTNYEDTSTYICNAGYEMSGSAAITCEASGAWSTHPVCNGKNCGLPPSVQNSNATYTSTVHTSRVKYKCIQGFKMDDNDVLTCNSGKWVGVVPFCSLIATKRLWLYLGVPAAMIVFGAGGIFTFIYCRFWQRKRLIEKLKNYDTY